MSEWSKIFAHARVFVRGSFESLESLWKSAKAFAWSTSSKSSVPTGSLSRRVFAALFCTSVIVAALIALVTTLVYQRTFMAAADEDLSRICGLIASALKEEEGFADAGTITSDATVADAATDAATDAAAIQVGTDIDILSMLDLGGIRITLLAADGTVLYDSFVDASTLPNHASRPEVSQAITAGEGSIERASDTAGYISLYHALRLADGRVLRLAEDQADVLNLLSRDLPSLFAVFVVLSLVCAGAARLISRWLMHPILIIDLNAKDSCAPYKELEPLSERLVDQRRELREKMRQLQDAADIRQQYTSNVTHELKTPIASISGASELIESGLVPADDIPLFAHRIHLDAVRLTSLVDDILTLSRLDESERLGDGSLLGPAESCDLLVVANEATGRLAGAAADMEVNLMLCGNSVNVCGRAHLLDELAINLISNAIRYNHPGGSVIVEVGIRDGQPYLEVSDTGIGISATEQDKVFARFYRVDTSRSRASGGTGLGLAIVKHVANLHRAEIQMQSQEEKGTKVTILFPAVSRSV